MIREDAVLALLQAQMLWLVPWQLLEEEKVQQAYLNRGSIEWLTHLPKLLKPYLSFRG